MREREREAAAPAAVTAAGPQRMPALLSQASDSSLTERWKKRGLDEGTEWRGRGVEGVLQKC